MKCVDAVVNEIDLPFVALFYVFDGFFDRLASAVDWVGRVSEARA